MRGIVETPAHTEENAPANKPAAARANKAADDPALAPAAALKSAPAVAGKRAYETASPRYQQLPRHQQMRKRTSPSRGTSERTPANKPVTTVAEEPAGGSESAHHGAQKGIPEDTRGVAEGPVDVSENTLAAVTSQRACEQAHGGASEQTS